LYKIKILKKIEEYKNIIFDSFTQPKPKNWERKLYTCSCNIPIISKDSDINDIIYRININYIITNNKSENVNIITGNSSWWRSKNKLNYWSITHLEEPKVYGSDISFIIDKIVIGYIERGGALTPTPLYITISDINKFNNILLKNERKNKLKNIKL